MEGLEIISSPIKSSTDKLIAAIALVIFFPLMVVISLLIKFTSPGPVLFKQQRNGFNGTVIEVWKFRSMVVHREGVDQVSQATKHDLRVTPIGRLIRRTSIDELPQLFNVLQGTMSLVGPRPHAVAHNEYYAEKIGSYTARHQAKPGMTGLAQIKGFRGETETLDKMIGRVEHDIDYIRRWNPWLDLKILFLTPVSLLSSDIY